MTIPEIEKSFIEKIILDYGNKTQDIVLIEELSELQKEITKSLRGKENLPNIVEEMAHCIISIQMCMKTHGISWDMIQSEIDKKVIKYT